MHEKKGKRSSPLWVTLPPLFDDPNSLALVLDDAEALIVHE